MAHGLRDVVMAVRPHPINKNFLQTSSTVMEKFIFTWGNCPIVLQICNNWNQNSIDEPSELAFRSIGPPPHGFDGLFPRWHRSSSASTSWQFLHLAGLSAPSGWHGKPSLFAQQSAHGITSTPFFVNRRGRNSREFFAPE
jgi:hypothetical protein